MAKQSHFPQRVIVKVHIPKHRTPQSGRDSLRRHVCYLSRESARVGADRPGFYDAKRDGIDPTVQTKDWSADRHHFRLVISAERGGDIADLRAYTREVMQRVQRDLGTTLEWFAINHFDTEHPHTHVVVRGRSEDGADLVIARDYISNGIRGRASDVATELLGDRTIDHAREANAKEVHAERWTGLDRLLQRFATPGKTAHRIEPASIRLSPYGPVERSMLVRRLEFLTCLGLAQEVTASGPRFRRRSRLWEVSLDAQKRLRELGARNDVIKQLYASLGREQAARIAPRIRQLQPDVGEKSPHATKGILIAKGAFDELSDARFMLVRDLAGGHHYTRVWPGEEYDAAQVGGVVELGRRTRRQHRMIETIARVAERDEGSCYSTGRHRRLIEAGKTQRTVAQNERRLKVFAARVLQLSRRTDTGVSRTEHGGYVVEPDRLRAYADHISRWPDVRVVAAYGLNEQVHAEAYTWLDRQLVRMNLHKAGFEWMKDAGVLEAVNERIDWLVARRYAERLPEREGQPFARFKPDAIRGLRDKELQAFSRQRKELDGRAVYRVRAGQSVTGRYRGLAPLHSGLFAMIESEDRLFAAPISRAPWAERGQLVLASRWTNGRVQIERAPDRTLKPGLER